MYKSWNTTVKLVWDLPRSTHNFFVEHLLAETFSSVRESILTQYVGFIQRLEKSVSTEVRLMRRIAGADIRSTTGKNVHNLMKEFKLDPWVTPSSVFKRKYKYYDLPEADQWRLPLLQSLMKERYEMSASGDETEDITGLIESLCSS